MRENAEKVLEGSDANVLYDDEEEGGEKSGDHHFRFSFEFLGVAK